MKKKYIVIIILLLGIYGGWFTYAFIKESQVPMARDRYKETCENYYAGNTDVFLNL